MTTEELEAVQGRTWEEWVFLSRVDLDKESNLSIVLTTK
jgi:hypothetical protein